MWGAFATIASSIISSRQSSGATRDASERIAEGTEASIAEQQRQFDLSRIDYERRRADAQPYRNVSVGALGQLSRMAGIPFDPSQYYSLEQGRASNQNGAGETETSQQLGPKPQFENFYTDPVGERQVSPTKASRMRQQARKEAQEAYAQALNQWELNRERQAQGLPLESAPPGTQTPGAAGRAVLNGFLQRTQDVGRGFGGPVPEGVVRGLPGAEEGRALGPLPETPENAADTPDPFAEYGDVLSRPELAPPTPEGLSERPGYQFRLAQGQQALERSQVGRRLSGRAVKEALRYGQGFASNEYDRELGRYYAEFDRDLNMYNQQFNQLATLAGFGPLAASNQGSPAYPTGIPGTIERGSQAQAQLGLANAQAQNQAIQGGLSNLATWYQYNQGNQSGQQYPAGDAYQPGRDYQSGYYG